MRSFVVLIFARLTFAGNAQALAANTTSSDVGAQAHQQPKVSAGALEPLIRDHPDDHSDERVIWSDVQRAVQPFEQYLAHVDYMSISWEQYIDVLSTRYKQFMAGPGWQNAFKKYSFQLWIQTILQDGGNEKLALEAASLTLLHLFGEKVVATRLKKAVIAGVPYAKELFDLQLQRWTTYSAEYLYKALELDVTDAVSFRSPLMATWYTFVCDHYSPNDVNAWLLFKFKDYDVIGLSEYLYLQEVSTKGMVLSSRLQSALFKHYFHVNHWTPNDYFKELGLHLPIGAMPLRNIHDAMYKRYAEAYKVMNKESATVPLMA